MWKNLKGFGKTQRCADYSVEKEMEKDPCKDDVDQDNGENILGTY